MNAAYVIRKNFSVIIKPTVKSPIAEISAGKLQGKSSTSRDGRKYFQYLGIPYAKPPVGPLRFEPPEPYTEQWEGVRDATKDGEKALQFNALSNKVIGSEDCLYLCVHTPRLDDANLPVFVWFHGGSFILGSGNDYKPDYFMEHDVVVVTVNYRLGCFGFMDTGDRVVRGNMGLKDQVMSLRWVQENVRNFGGNPNDVTIGGESAGGSSVHFHVLSRMSSGLFHKAVSQSGFATLPFALHRQPEKLSRKFGELLNACMDSTQNMVNSLREMDAAKLAAVPLGMFDNFRPTIEVELGDGQAIITEHPLTIIESGNFNRVPYLVGVNSGEGILLASPALTTKEIKEGLATDWSGTLAPRIFFPEGADVSKLEETKQLYLDGEFNVEDPLIHMQGMANLFSDWIWYLGFQRAMTLHSVYVTKETPLFIYYYDYYGKYSLADMVLAIGGDYHPVVELIKIKGKKWIKEKIKKEEIPKYGCCHGDGLSLQWYMPEMAYVPRKSPDYETSKEIIDSLVQFIKWTPDQCCLSFQREQWKRQEPGEPLKYMHISKTPRMIPEPFTDRLEFWKQFDI